MYLLTSFVGYAQQIRDELSEIKILQNLQMARLCDIEGKTNVHIDADHGIFYSSRDWIEGGDRVFFLYNPGSIVVENDLAMLVEDKS